MQSNQETLSEETVTTDAPIEADPAILARIAVCERLAVSTLQLSDEDLTALVHVAEGLASGRQVCGRISIDDDRNFARDAPHEMRDALVHLSGRLLR